MQRRGNEQPFRPNEFNDSISAVKKNSFHCIYNDSDNYDSYLGAWVLDSILKFHTAKVFTPARQFSTCKRLPNGFLFMLGITFNKKTMRQLIDHASCTVIMSNSPFDRFLLEELSKEYPKAKLKVVYDVTKKVCELARTAFGARFTTSIVDKYVEFGNSKDFIGIIENTNGSFNTLTKIEKDFEENYESLVIEQRQYDKQVLDEWKVLVSEIEDRQSVFTTCGVEIPVLKIDRAKYRRGITQKFLKKSKSSIAGVVYQFGEDLRFHIQSTSASPVSAGTVASTFGGNTPEHTADFVVKNLTLEDLF